METQPELVAQHYTAAGCVAQAIPYLQRAGAHASERSAHLEAITHLTQGLELLQTLPATPERHQHELAFHIALGASLLATKGQAAPEVQQTYARARQLCHHVEDPQQLFSVLRGLWNYYQVRGELQTARTLSTHLLTLAQQVHDAGMLPAAHRAVGSTLSYMGDKPRHDILYASASLS